MAYRLSTRKQMHLCVPGHSESDMIVEVAELARGKGDMHMNHEPRWKGNLGEAQVSPGGAAGSQEERHGCKCN
jgi:hypothetical protein